jgi:DNA-binding transcriptional MerR regulator
MQKNLTTEQVAREFDKSVRTIRAWVQLGLLRPIPHCKPYQFPPNEVVRRKTQIQPAAIY